MMNEQLAGTLVLVHPELPDDPAGRQNAIGSIAHTDLLNDDVFVSFRDGVKALYAPDALLVFLPGEDIHRNLAQMGFDTAWDNIKSLTQIDLFLRYGSAERHIKAMELARDHKNIQALCLQTLENSLEINRGIGYE